MRKLLFLFVVFLFGFVVYSMDKNENSTDPLLEGILDEFVVRGRPGVPIGGVRWATRNVDTPGTFAQYPEHIGMFYQWNRRQGKMPICNNWDNSWPGRAWLVANDPCPDGWRVPTMTELYSLRNAPSVWYNRNGVNGRLFGTYPYQIFLPAGGYRHEYNGRRINPQEWGFYWSRTPADFTNSPNRRDVLNEWNIDIHDRRPVIESLGRARRRFPANPNFRPAAFLWIQPEGRSRVYYHHPATGMSIRCVAI